MKRQISGVVTANGSDKTIVVTETRRVTHPIYRKQYPVSKKHHAHDEKNEVNVGDEVTIEEVTPMSKMKKWKLVEVTKKAVVDEDIPA